MRTLVNLNPYERVHDRGYDQELYCNEVLQRWCNVFGAEAHVHDIKDDSGHEGEHAGEMGHTGLHELLPILHGAPTRPHQVDVGPDDQHGKHTPVW